MLMVIVGLLFVGSSFVFMGGIGDEEQQDFSLDDELGDNVTEDSVANPHGSYSHTGVVDEKDIRDEIVGENINETE